MIFANEKYVQEQVNPLIEYMQKLGERQQADTITLTDNLISMQNRVDKLEKDLGNTELKDVVEAMQLEIINQKDKTDYLKKIIEDTLSLVQKVVHPAPASVPKTPEDELNDIEEKFAQEPEPIISKMVDGVDTTDQNVAYCLYCKKFNKMNNIKVKETRMGNINQGECATCGRLINRKQRKK